jgi:hypothetical protein
VPKPPWRARKEAYLARLAEAPGPALRVVAADKLHNLRAILRDHRAQGEGVWTRFNASRDDLLWYYREVVARVSARGPAALAAELARVLGDLQDAVSTPPPPAVPGEPRTP